MSKVPLCFTFMGHDHYRIIYFGPTHVAASATDNNFKHDRRPFTFLATGITKHKIAMHVSVKAEAINMGSHIDHLKVLSKMDLLASTMGATTNPENCSNAYGFLASLDCNRD